jgi:hypothetical protein
MESAFGRFQEQTKEVYVPRHLRGIIPNVLAYSRVKLSTRDRSNFSLGAPT